jgi:hypothetical protein
MADTPDVQQPLPTPDQQADAATAGPQPSQGSDQPMPGAAPAAAPAAASAAVPAPAAAPTAQSIGDKTKHILGDIFQTIAGGKKVVWQQTPNGPVKTYEDLKPGEMARGILAAAITGLASGYDPANRGKGPAMSSAFSAGFKGEEAAREKQATTDQAQAQEQFTNQNASDELMMKKQRFATEQQQSILDYQKTQQAMDQAKERSRQEGIVFDQGQRAYFDALDAKYAGEIAKGGKPIDDPKNPGQPLVFWDRNALQQYANEHGKELVAPGEFDTKIMARPDGSWVIMKTPLAEREKRSWRFAAMDPKDPNKPLMKDGKVVPSGEKDQSGRVIPPALMSGEEYGNKITELDAHRKSAASAEDLLSQAAERRAIAAKDAKYAVAQDQLAKAGNDPNAVDISNGAFIVSDKNRGMLVNQRMMMFKAQEAAWQKADKEFKELPPDQQTPELRTQIEAARIQTEELRKQWDAASTAPVTPSQAMTQSLLRRFDGDPEKAAKYFDDQAKAGKYAANLLPQDIDTVRKNLVTITKQQQDQAQQKKAAPAAQQQDEFGPSAAKDFLTSPAVIQGAQAIIQQELQKGSFYDVQRGIRNDTTLSKADKMKLLDYLASTPYNVTLKDGSSIQVGPDQINSFLTSNPGATPSTADALRYQQQKQQEQKQQREDEETQKQTDINSQS